MKENTLLNIKKTIIILDSSDVNYNDFEEMFILNLYDKLIIKKETPTEKQVDKIYEIYEKYMEEI